MKYKKTIFGIFTILLLLISGCSNNYFGDKDQSNQTPVIEDANGQDNRTPDEYVQETIQEEFVDDDIEIGELI